MLFREHYHFHYKRYMLRFITTQTWRKVKHNWPYKIPYQPALNSLSYLWEYFPVLNPCKGRHNNVKTLEPKVPAPHRILTGFRRTYGSYKNKQISLFLVKKKTKYYLLSQMCKHFSSIDERHEEINVAIVLKGEFQGDQKRKFCGLQDLLFVKSVLYLLELYDANFVYHFHGIVLFVFSVLH